MRKYPYTNIGQCIYCDSTEEPLTREHVVAAGLGGNRTFIGEHEALVLKRATCESCREITRQIEARYLQETLGRARRRLGLTRKDRQVDNFKTSIIRSGGTTWSDESIDFRRLDAPLLIPSFRTAKILDQSADDTFDLWVMNTADGDVAADPTISNYQMTIPLNVPNFARLLAKIAHGYLVASLGPKGFEPLAREIILQGRPDWYQLVGGFAPQRQPSSEGLPLHFLAHRNEGPYLMVGVQLFAQFGGPLNYVIAGKVL